MLDIALELEQAKYLDPLDMSESLTSNLPALNLDGDVLGVQSLADYAVAKAQMIDFTGQPRLADAAIRDLDFVAASLLKGGVDPRSTEGLEAMFATLGEVAGTVPRGTVYTYSLQNPAETERTFTGTTQEHYFIQTVREASGIMLGQCAKLCQIDPQNNDTETIAEALTDTADTMRDVVKGMVGVSREVTPQFFSGTMRPFFDGITIGDTTFAGAGGAQLPLVVIDRLLWGAENGCPAYGEYFEDNVRYQPGDLRAMLTDAQASGGYEQSLVATLQDRHARGEDVEQAIEATVGLLKQIKRFRLPHCKVAKDNFSLRNKDAVGSGQYTPTILDTLIAHTEQAMKSLSIGGGAQV